MRLLPVLVLALATGCASSLSTLQTARPLSPGQIQVSYGVAAFVPAGQLVTALDSGVDEGERALEAHERGEPYTVSEEGRERLFIAAVALAVAPPGVNTELMARAGVAENLELGLRYSGISLRLDGKYRLLHGGDPDTGPMVKGRSYDLAVGLGVSRHSFKGLSMDVLEVVEINEFSRFDVEVPLYVSADWGDVFKLYGAPKYVFSRTSLDPQLVDYAAQGGPRTSLPSRVNSHFVGSTLGVALGYKYVHLYAELTGGYTFLRPRLLGEDRDLGGVTLYPMVGLAVRPFADRPSGRQGRVSTPGR